MGRKSKYSPEVAAKIVANVAKGLTKETSAQLAGIGFSTLYDWQRDKPEFAALLREGEAKRLAVWEESVGKTAKIDGSLALRALRATNPKAWAKDRQTQPQTHQHLHVALSPEQALGFQGVEDDE
jgi:hypothetical protein